VVAESGLFSDFIGFHNLLYGHGAELCKHGDKGEVKSAPSSSSPLTHTMPL
jgi:hypothetical protein